MDPGAEVVGILEQVAEVVGKPEQVIAVREAAQLAPERHVGVVLGGLKHEACRRCLPKADATGVTVRQHRSRHMGAMAGIHILSPVRDDSEGTDPTRSVDPRIVKNLDYPRGRDVRVRVGAGVDTICGVAILLCIADTGVGHRHDLGRTVISRRVGGGDADDGTGFFVVGDPQVVRLDPRHAVEGDDGYRNSVWGGSDDQVTTDPQDFQAVGGCSSRHFGRVGVRIDANPYHLAGIVEAGAHPPGGFELDDGADCLRHRESRCPPVLGLRTNSRCDGLSQSSRRYAT